MIESSRASRSVEQKGSNSRAAADTRSGVTRKEQKSRTGRVAAVAVSPACAGVPCPLRPPGGRDRAGAGLGRRG